MNGAVRNMKNHSNIFIITPLLVMVIIVLAGCTQLIDSTQPKDTEKIEFQEIPRFSNYQDLINTFQTNRDKQRTNGGIFDTFDSVVPLAAVAQESASAGPRNRDYSETNIQVEGVDEADIVKTDGQYIYTFSGSSLAIVNAHPIETSKIVSETTLHMTPQEMFINGNRIILFGSPRPEKADFSIVGADFWYGGNIAVHVYDITDRTAPELVKEFEFEGRYLSSRLIGNKTYFVINSYPDYRKVYDSASEDNETIIPLMKEDRRERLIAVPEEIGYIPPMVAENFLTIASLDVDTLTLQKETILGSGQNIFASHNAIYIASTQWIPDVIPFEKQVDTFVPGTINARRIFIGNTGKQVTHVMKFGLDKGKIGYVAQGQVPGSILNQFSMDEFDGKFRIATTTGQVSRNGESQSENNLYILDEKMELLGKIEGIAPGERIYSARFVGKKAYMVTFKKVDPFFVIDVSDPSNPIIEGKLKIPGYSDYLHPFDETHVIGIGKDTIESKEGTFAWYQGLKMAIFDVTDVSNPIELHKTIVGDRGTGSYALTDHKAFLFDKEKELLVLPVTLAEIPAEKKAGGPIDENGYPLYGEQNFQGAMVFSVSLQNGFEERGRITHITDEEELKRGYYYDYRSTVKRSLYIEDVLYTVSERMVQAHSLDTLQKLKMFVFELVENEPIYPYLE
jgi:inhibitor of cysteine peptidase